MFFCPSVINKGVGFCLPSLGVIDEVASLVEEWGWGWVLVTPRRGIDMPAPGNARGIGCSRDTPPKGAKE